MAEVITFLGLGYECNSYLIIDRKVILIDTGTGSSETLKEKVNVISKKVDLIINTHAHLDHVGGNSHFQSKVAIYKDDANMLESGGLYGTGAIFGKNASSKADKILGEGEVIETGEMNLTVFHTPGHTPGSICLLSDQGHLFSGDTLFSGGNFGRTDLPGGNTIELLASLERLKSLPFEQLMPGHMDQVINGKEHLEAAISIVRRIV
jgi:glyoxylase-like metal-dependent hydrolase (beta-lactamase superfamily II)